MASLIKLPKLMSFGQYSDNAAHWKHDVKDLLFEMCRYSITGITNTSIYAATGLLLHYVGGLEALLANFLALLLSFMIGFLGHNFYTYRQTRIAPQAIVRFILLQLLALMVSQSIVYLVVEVQQWNYEIAVLLSVAVLPPLCWSLGHFWVFQGQRRASRRK